MKFLTTTYLSDIIDNSRKQPVIIFKYSNSCGSSERLKNDFENMSQSENLPPIYLITVQIQRGLSKQIEEFYGIKHESPQVIVLSSGEVTFSANHSSINTADLLKLKL